MWKTLLVGIYCRLILASFSPNSYENYKELSAYYTLYWTADVNNDVLYLAVEAETTGWVGFGLGEPTSGSMPGADILVAWVDSNNQAHVSDRYALDFSTPLEDGCQDWTLISGIEEDGK